MSCRGGGQPCPADIEKHGAADGTRGGSTAQAIPYRIAPEETLGRSSKGDLECPYRATEPNVEL
jgi:hypothetical protein